MVACLMQSLPNRTTVGLQGCHPVIEDQRALKSTHSTRKPVDIDGCQLGVMHLKVGKVS